MLVFDVVRLRRRSRSSVEERPPHTRKVAGSIPAGTTYVVAGSIWFLALLDKPGVILVLSGLSNRNPRRMSAWCWHDLQAMSNEHDYFPTFGLGGVILLITIWAILGALAYGFAPMTGGGTSSASRWFS